MSTKTRPILFNGSMVRAILAGKKTQTRRIMKPQPDHELERLGECEDMLFGVRQNGKIGVWRSPFGNAGDRLWVRETWAVVPHVTDNGPKHRAKGDGTGATWRADWDGNPSGFKWKPSIHMPRWASRITLEITDVGVERLNDISEADASAEGVERIDLGPTHLHGMPVHPYTSYYWEAFKALWESINGKGSWEKNPWVWVVSFERVDS